MDDSVKRRVEELTEQAISGSAHEDFREGYRARLRWLKDARPQAFSEGLAYYNDVLVPNIAAGSEPIREWLDYGQRLGELSGAGKTVCIDETGRARPFSGEVRDLVLHLPEDTAVPALALAVPKATSDAQRATLDLLVRS